MRTEIKWWVFTGPESTAKSSLAQRIAEKTGYTLVKEQARSLLEKGQYPEVGETELLAIAEHQWAAEILTHAQEGLPIILDTDLLTIKIWYEWVFNRPCPAHWEERLRSREGVRYLLCHPDIDWEPDPLRSNPFEREELLAKYKQSLTDLGYDYIEIRGEGNERWQAVLNAFGIS